MQILRQAFLIAALATCVAAGAAHADGNATQGKLVFERCAICHSATKGAPNQIGPNLFGVVGRKAGTEPGFNYSSAMKHSGITWTPVKLAAYISKPQKVVSGNKMAFAGISSHSQVEDVVAYLKTLK